MQPNRSSFFNMDALARSNSEARQHQFKRFRYAHEYTAELDDIWPPPIIVSESVASELAPETENRIRFSKSRPVPLQWTIAFMPTFRASLEKLDRRLKGRVLEALAFLSETPRDPRGDTVKPLEGEMKGKWRYRLGDHRLVYEPRENDRIVVLIYCEPRGSVYQH